MVLRVGIAGYGLAGRYLHAPLIAATGMEIVAVCSSRVDEIGADYPDAAVVATYDELVARADVDLIVVVTPTYLHFPQVKQALEAGKHVVVDKPFTLTADEAGILDALAQEKGLKLSVYHNRRWDSDFLTIKKLLDAKTLGEIYRFEMRWDRYTPEVKQSWREQTTLESGMFMDLGAHLFDQSLQFFGKPDWIQGDVFTQRDGARSFDCFEVLMGLGRMRVSLGISPMAVDNAFRYRIFGDKGSFVKGGLDMQEAHLVSGVSPLDAAYGIEPESQHGVLTTIDGARTIVPSEVGSWISFYHAMIAAIEQGADVPVSASSARDVMVLLQAAGESSDAGKRINLK